ncbi:MAG: hypothetical protein H8E66_27240 [Planctomycetes bacterium]|nr:hypothetical protein [Planctomycetota bacterium]
MSFDPYHQWLGIPPAEQPPNYYRLLGVGVFESNPDVISSAADRQMAHVKTFQMGQHVAASQRLLSEVVAARGCLLNDESRAAYDFELRSAATTPPPASTAATVAVPEISTSAPSRRKPQGRSPQKVLVITSVVAIVAIVLIVVSIIFRSGGRDLAEHPVRPMENPADTNTSEQKAGETSPLVPALPEADVNASMVTENPKPTAMVTPNEVSVPDAIPESSTEPTEVEPVEADNVIEPVLDPEPPAPTLEPEPPPKSEFQLPGKSPIPGQAEQAVAKALVREVYQPEYEQAETFDQKGAVAKKLLAAAKDPGNDANARYAMLDVSRVMAVQAGDADGTFAAIDEMDAYFEIDALVLKQAALQAWAKKTLKKEIRAELAKRMPPVAEEAARYERYDVALTLLQLARDTARRAGDVQFAKDAAARLKEINEIATQFAEVKRALELLAVDNSDEAANEIVGRYYCMVRGDWDGGLPLLAKSGKGALQTSAERDLSGADPGEQQLALGDMWWELAQEEEAGIAQQLLVRAHHWYSAAAPNLSGLARAKCEKRLAETALAAASVAGVQGTLSAKSRTGLVFDGTGWIETDLKYDGKTPLTIEAWVTPAGGVGQIVANCHGNGLALQATATGHWGFHVRDNKTYQQGTSNDNVRIGHRTHVAGVFDGRMVRLYVNGQLQDQVGTMTSGNKVSPFHFMIGADPDFNSKPQSHFKGSIDSVHVAFADLYQRNFTPRDPPTRTPASVLLLKLDEGEGDIAKDTSARRHDAKIHGAKWKSGAPKTSPIIVTPKSGSSLSFLRDALLVLTLDPLESGVRDSGPKGQIVEVNGAQVTAAGKVGNALTFDGISNAVAFPQLRDHIVQDLKAISLCGWARSNELKPTAFLFDVGFYADKAISVLNEDNQLTFNLVANLVKTPDLDIRQWYHFAAVWDGVDQRLYVNGELKAMARPSRPVSLTSNTIDNLPAHLGANVKPDKRRKDRFYNGLIDEFVIVPQALSEREIQQLYRLGVAGFALN